MSSVPASMMRSYVANCGRQRRMRPIMRPSISRLSWRPPMAEQTLGEQERAFQDWLINWQLANSVSDHTESNAYYEGRRVRASFAAGVQYGQELHGCCQEQEHE